MVNRLIVANLIIRPVRTLASVMAVGVEVVLIIMVVGLTHGMLEENATRTMGVGAEIMVQPKTTSALMAFNGAPMPIQIRDRLLAVPNVKSVAPVMVQVSSAGLTLIYGIEVESFNAVTGGFQFLQGHGIEAPDDVVVDDIYARSQKLKAGQTVELLNHPFHLAGIVEHGKGARLFVRLDTLQDLMGSSGKASLFFVKLDSPQFIPPVAEAFGRLLPGYQIRNMQEYMSLMTPSHIPGLSNFINVMIALAVCIGLLVIFITIYSTIVERTREIGILKSIGASKAYIANMIFRETALLTILGIGAGIAFSYLLRGLIGHIFPSMPILITLGWMLRAGLIALGASLLGAAYPVFRATQQDAIAALAYE